MSRGMVINGKLQQLLVFVLDDQRYALYLSAVVRVFRAVEITLLPFAPPIISGVINVHGEIVPVVDTRKRFRMPEKKIEPDDHLIVALTSRRKVALVVDKVLGVVERPEEEIISAQKILPHLKYVEGVVKLEDGLVLVHDLDRFLSLEEEEALDHALSRG